MSLVDGIVLKVRQGKTPFYRMLRNAAGSARGANLPLPAFMMPLCGTMYRVHFGIRDMLHSLVTFCYREPLFRGRCAKAGKRLRIDEFPVIYGHTRIYLGDDVAFNGKVSIASGRFHEEPRLVIGNRCALGHRTLLSVNKEVILEDDVLIANDCWIGDNDGHPRAADLRAAHAPLGDRDIKPVHIGESVWIGRGACILKGVIIGKGAIIGANSVVISDVPAYALVMGNPAEIILRGIGKPSERRVQPIHRASVAPQE
jgi:acetyltransferase-like isoleucine patch superfamily enzyme